jgi:hypothetical protein
LPLRGGPTTAKPKLVPLAGRLLTRADEAIYRANGASKNRCHLAAGARAL